MADPHSSPLPLCCIAYFPNGDESLCCALMLSCAEIRLCRSGEEPVVLIFIQTHLSSPDFLILPSLLAQQQISGEEGELRSAARARWSGDTSKTFTINFSPHRDSDCTLTTDNME
ncbi:unnamed protein product [Leuciscus chuanchicus]